MYQHDFARHRMVQLEPGLPVERFDQGVVDEQLAARPDVDRGRVVRDGSHGSQGGNNYDDA